MKVNFNPTHANVHPDSMLSMNTIYNLINDDVETYFGNIEDKTGQEYVVFDGTAKILCEGTLQECFCYYEIFYKYQGFLPMIYSREKYVEMMKVINNE